MSSRGKKGSVKVKVSKVRKEEELPPDKYFYFYRNLGEPLGVSAKDLGDFHGKLQSIEPASIKFHLERGDFQNWLKMLGETDVAASLDELKGKGLTPEELQQRTISIISDSLRR